MYSFLLAGGLLLLGGSLGLSNEALCYLSTGILFTGLFVYDTIENGDESDNRH